MTIKIIVKKIHLITLSYFYWCSIGSWHFYTIIKIFRRLTYIINLQLIFWTLFILQYIYSTRLFTIQLHIFQISHCYVNKHIIIRKHFEFLVVTLVEYNLEIFRTNCNCSTYLYSIFEFCTFKKISYWNCMHVANYSSMLSRKERMLTLPTTTFVKT